MKKYTKIINGKETIVFDIHDDFLEFIEKNKKLLEELK